MLWLRGDGGALDQWSSALGFRADTARAQSHLTRTSAHNVRMNAVGSLFRTAVAGRPAPVWSQDQPGG